MLEIDASGFFLLGFWESGSIEIRRENFSKTIEGKEFLVLGIWVDRNSKEYDSGKGIFGFWC